jgi:hypothetical protein
VIATVEALQSLGQYVGDRAIHDIYDQGLLLLDLVTSLHNGKDSGVIALNIPQLYLITNLIPQWQIGTLLDKDVVLADCKRFRPIGIYIIADYVYTTL